MQVFLGTSINFCSCKLQNLKLTVRHLSLNSTLILIIRVPRNLPKNPYFPVTQRAAEVKRVLPNNVFALNRLPRDERRAFCHAYLRAVLLALAHALADASMQIGDFLNSRKS